MRRFVLTLLVVDACVVLAAVGIWTWTHRDDERRNAVNGDLRGSRPPAGQRLPDLAGIAGVDPPLPERAELDGRPVMIAATCLACRSGDVFGGFLGRLTTDEVPHEVQVLVVGWNGDMSAWAREWRIGAHEGLKLAFHEANSPATVAKLRRQFGIGPRAGSDESGIVFLYDRQGRWRSTYFLGQLQRDDIRHDLELLSQ